MATKIILDVDTGTDDAVALMTAALSPDIELVGATVVNGNTVLDSCVENTLRVVEWIGMPEIPVFRGMSRPLARPQATQANPATLIHGDKLDLPEATIRAQRPARGGLADRHAPRVGRRHHARARWVRSTNIATAIQKEPRILEQIPEIVIMGGAHDHGNATASAEFNIWLDPEAARIVVNCGRPIRMVPLDATHRALVSLEDAERLRALGTPAGEAAYRFISKRIEGYDATQPMHRAGAAPVHDALAVCAVIDPTVITTHFIPVDVETGGELSVGRTVCDFRFRSHRPANVQLRDGRGRAEVRRDAHGRSWAARPADEARPQADQRGSLSRRRGTPVDAPREAQRVGVAQLGRQQRLGHVLVRDRAQEAPDRGRADRGVPGVRGGRPRAAVVHRPGDAHARRDSRSRAPGPRARSATRMMRAGRSVSPSATWRLTVSEPSMRRERVEQVGLVVGSGRGPPRARSTRRAAARGAAARSAVVVSTSGRRHGEPGRVARAGIRAWTIGAGNGGEARRCPPGTPRGCCR